MKCCWVLRPAEVGKPALYCHKPTKYQMVRDDDERLVRKYHSFCPEHQKALEAQPKDEEYDV